jgi:signal transduction histidine kinase
MPAEDFQALLSVDKARSRDLGSAGIGLAIAEWILEHHLGSTKVQSSVGKGSTFLVEFSFQATKIRVSKPALAVSTT